MIGVPVAKAIDISIALHPSMNTVGCLLRIVGEHLRVRFVLTISGYCRHVLNLLTLRMILHNLPVLLDRNVDVAKFDLSHFLLLNQG